MTSTPQRLINARRVDSFEDASTTGRNQLVTFRVNGANYALSILCVREVRAWSPITPLPNSAEHIAGILNLRGSIIPIVDLQLLFGHGKTQPTASHMIIIITTEGRLQGLLVDTVSDIVSVTAADIRPLPTMGADSDRAPFDGIVVRDDSVIALLSADKLLASSTGVGQVAVPTIGSVEE